MFYDIQKKKVFIPEFLNGGALGYTEAFYYDDLDTRQKWWFGNLFIHEEQDHYIRSDIPGKHFNLNSLGKGRIDINKKLGQYYQPYLFLGKFESEGEFEDGQGECTTTFNFDSTSQDVLMQVGDPFNNNSYTSTLPKSSAVFTKLIDTDKNSHKEEKWSENFDILIVNCFTVEFYGDYISAMVELRFARDKKDEWTKDFEEREREENGEIIKYWVLVDKNYKVDCELYDSIHIPEILTPLGTFPEYFFEKEYTPTHYEGSDQSKYSTTYKTSGHLHHRPYFTWEISDKFESCNRSVEAPEDETCDVWDAFNWNCQGDEIEFHDYF